jgi:hypothetical protein
MGKLTDRRLDLYNLDIANGQCVNSSIPQNVTFGEQGGVLGHNSSGALRVPVVSGLHAWAVALVAIAAAVSL